MGKPQSRPSRQPSDSLGGTKRKFKREVPSEQQSTHTAKIPSNITRNGYNNAVMDLTRQQLKTNFSTFILNQMLLGIQFFGNFERDKQQARERCSSFEKELADKLENFSIILPNVLDEAVEKRVQYKPKHGPNKANISKLSTQQVYVVFEKLEISKREDPNYAEITTSPPTSKLFIDMEHCNSDDLEKARKGYVQLKWRQDRTRSSPIIRNPHIHNEISKSDTENSLSECEMDSNSCSESIAEQYGCWNVDSRKSSGNMTSASCNTYDYLYTTRLNTHLPLYELIFNGDSSHMAEIALPIECISKVVLSDGLLQPEETEEAHENPGPSVCSCGQEAQKNVEDTGTVSYVNSMLPLSYFAQVLKEKIVPELGLKPKETDETNKNPEPPACSCEQQAQDEDDSGSDCSDETICPQDDQVEDIVTVSYVNSMSFLSYFAQILKEKIAPELGVAEKDLENGTFREASIFVSTYEMIPALHYPHWPDCASDWIKRPRTIHLNYGDRIQWPTPEMIQTVVSFGCHAIPIGYSTKKEKNLTRDLEWKIVFPKAERYLESQLLSTQAKIYMFCKALIKTHYEPKQTGNVRMFTLDHLRTHLFWACEENYMAWPDVFLGEVLLRFLKSFLDRLSSKTLPDYFIPKRNLFANIPEDSIAKLHQLITRIVWNAVMYTTRVYRDVLFTPDFYPKFDYKKIYACIVVENPLLLMRLRDMKPVEAPSQNNTIASIKKDKKAQTTVGNKRKMPNRRKKRKEQKPEEEVKKRSSVDSVDLQFIIEDSPSGPENELHSSPDDIRRIWVVKTFVSFFISMAKAAIDYKAFDQSKLYLSQCYRLCTILQEYGEDTFEAQSKSEVKRIEAILMKSQELTNGPALPARTNLEPVRSFRQYRQPLTAYKASSENGRFEKHQAARAVQFNKVSNFIEPRSSLFARADLSSEPQLKIPRPILKQSSVESTGNSDSKILSNNDVIENWRKNGTIKLADDIQGDSDSEQCCTEL